MTYRFLMSAMLAATLFGFAATPAPAAQVLFETVKDWKVLKETDEKGAVSCILTRAYKDEGDDDATSIVFVPDGDEIALALGYGGWTYEKDTKVVSVFLMGGKVVDLRSKWTGDGTQLVTTIPSAMLPTVLQSDNLVLRFKAGDAEFKIPAVREAFEAVKRCAAPVPMPSDTRIASYGFGVLLEKVLKECNVATTGKQRSEFEAKMAALKPEMVAVDTQLRLMLIQNPPSPLCPPADKGDVFTTKLNQFIALTPEAFAAEQDRAQAEAEKKAADAKAAADMKTAADKKAADDKTAAEKAASDKAAADKASAESRVAAEKAAAETKAAESKAADDKAAVEKAMPAPATPKPDAPPADTATPRP